MTHDPESAKRADRNLEMFDGQLIKDTKLSKDSERVIEPAIELVTG